MIGGTVICTSPDLAAFGRVPKRSMPKLGGHYTVIGHIWMSRNPEERFLRLDGLPKSRIYCASGFSPSGSVPLYSEKEGCQHKRRRPKPDDGTEICCDCGSLIGLP